MLSNAYVLAKFRFNKAENEPAKNLQNLQNLEILRTLLTLTASLASPSAAAGGRGRARGAAARRRGPRGGSAPPWGSCKFFGKCSARCRSFSAVSAPIFARKYAFCSIFQNLPDYLAEFFLNLASFANFATFANILLNFHKNCSFFQNDFC